MTNESYKIRITITKVSFFSEWQLLREGPSFPLSASRAIQPARIVIPHMCDQLYIHLDLNNWSFVWRISPLLRIAAWVNFGWSPCDASAGYQYIKTPDVFMQMKRFSNDFLSIHIPSYLLSVLCAVFHFCVPFCCLPLSSFSSSHFALLSSHRGQNMWQEREKRR